MKSWIRLSLFALIVCPSIAMTAPALAEPKRPKKVSADTGAKAPEALDLWLFRCSLNSAYQATGGYSVSAGASWNPSYRLSDSIKIVGQLGASEYNTELDTYFTSLEYGAFAAFPIANKWEIEVGAGAEYWLGDGGNANSPAINTNVVYDRSGADITVKKIVIGYSGVIISNMFTHILKIGFEI